MIVAHDGHRLVFETIRKFPNKIAVQAYGVWALLAIAYMSCTL